MDIWSELILYFLSTSGIIAATVSLFKQRNLMKWENQYEKKIERLKGEIHQNNEIMKSSLNIFSQGYNLAQDKRLEAIELMWDQILEFRNDTSTIVGYYNITLSQDYNHETDEMFLSKNTTSKKEEKDSLSITNKTENKRPYLGEKLWGLFVIYRAFSKRLVYTFENHFQKGTIKQWYKDDLVMLYLETALGKEEYEKYKENKLYKFGSLSEAINIIEQKILFETNKIITGTYASEESFHQARKLLGIVDQYEKEIKAKRE